MRIPGGAGSAKAPHFLRDLGDGWSAFTEHTWVWVLPALISLFFLVCYAPFFVLGPFIARRSMDGAAGWATVLTGEAIGACSAASRRPRAARRPLALIGSCR